MISHLGLNVINKMIEPIKKARLEVVDSLRGFAIMGILLLHSVEHFNFYVFPDKSTQPDWLNGLDVIVWDSLFFLFGGKGYAIFALLFGFTFSLMYAKQAAKGIDFGYRFLYRMLLLACFAFFNGLFFPGEVLLLYSIIGITLFVVRKFSDKALLICAILLLSQPIELGRFFYFLYDPSYSFTASPTGILWKLLTEGQLSNSILDLFKSNTLYGHKAGLLWAYEVGRLVQSAGLFVLGYWIGRKNLFEYTDQSVSFWKRALWISVLLFIPLYFIEVNFNSISSLDIYKSTLFRAIDMYGNLTFTCILVTSFILLYRLDGFKKIAGGFRYCGRMSLTAYIFQSILGSFVFYNYGLGLGPHLRHTLSFIVGILLFVIQFYFCKFWINKFKQGPLEKLWHQLTWLNYKNKVSN